MSQLLALFVLFAVNVVAFLAGRYVGIYEARSARKGEMTSYDFARLQNRGDAAARRLKQRIKEPRDD
jgi:hypothetical protein